MFYKVIADIIVLIHFLWILFLILGAFWGVKYRAIRILHLSGLIFAFTIQIFDWYCPLTHLEVWLRSKHNPALTYTGSFIIHYVEKIVYIELSRNLIAILTIVLCGFNVWFYLREAKTKGYLRRYTLLFLLYYSILNFGILVSSQIVYASEIDDNLTFKRIALLGLEDKSKEGYGNIINNSLRNNIMDTMRFEMVIPEEIKRYPKTSKEVIKIGKGLNADAALTGTIKLEENTLKMSAEIINIRTGDLFAIEYVWLKGELTELAIEKAVKELVNKLISRIPYKAIVIEIFENDIIINAGKIRGVEEGTKLFVFEIKGIERHPFTDEIISFEKEEIGELTVVKVEDTITRARVKNIKKGKIVKVNNKIDFKPSLKVITDHAAKRKDLLAIKEKEMMEKRIKKEPEAEGKKPNIIGVDAVVGLTNNNYNFNSNELKLTRKASSFLTAGFKGELWPLSFLGIDLSYKTGWIAFDELDSSSIDTKARPYWLSTNLKYRYIFTDKPTSPHVIGKVGYHIYDFSVNESDSRYFNNYSYKGINIGLGAKIPFGNSFGANINADYQPRLSVKEDPVTSGTTGTATGYLLDLGLYYILTDGFIVNLNYNYSSYKANFEGTGTRGSGTTSASSTDTFNWINLSFRYEF